MRFWYLVLIITSLGLTSCLEIIDDLSLNLDGSGIFKYTVNLSSSKVKVNSYLALDSLDGKKVPEKDDVIARIDKVVNLLREQPGITEVQFDGNYTDYLFKLQVDFESVNDLQKAIKEVVKTEFRDKEIEELDHDWLSYDGSSLARSVPKMTIHKVSELSSKDILELQKGSYMAISRFPNEIAECSNENANLSKNKKAVMIKTDPYSLVNQTDLLDISVGLVDTTETN